MSAAALDAPLPRGAPALRPAWLRPTALALILAGHVALLLEVKPVADSAPPLDSMEVALVPLGDSDEDLKAQEEIKPAEQAPPAAQSPESALSPSELTAPPPRQIAPEAPPLPVAKPQPEVKPKPQVKPKPKPEIEESEEQPSPAELRRIERRKREEAQERHEAQEERRKAQEARLEARRGLVQGAARAHGMSQASYAGLVSGEIKRHRYLAAVRAAGITGSVGLTFTIGPAGRVIRQSVTRSSGNGALDGAARAIISAIHPPPPPNGSFSSTIVLKFNMN
jgi:protein TonB